MESELLLEQLLAILGKCGISCEQRNLEDDEVNIKSGLCEIESQKTLILDTRLPANLQVKVLLKTLKTENLEDFFLPPAIREMIEKAGD